MASILFSQENNRLNYSELLLPEEDYQVDFAVGLTYSLDLEAMLLVPISLGMFDDIDSMYKNNPYYLLEAIRRVSDKLAIICNAGSIKVPKEAKSVFALMENSIFQVLLPGKANFHPKFWVIKYTNKENESYIKIIVLSRNLSFDRSFDVAVEMTGDLGTSTNTKHQPISDMLNFVAKYADKTKRKEIKKLANDVIMVKNFSLSNEFEDYNFHPFGIGKEYNNTAEKILSDNSITDLFIISPFITDKVLKKVTEDLRYKALLTRKNSLTPEIISMFNNTYIAKSEVLTNEIIEEETESESSDFRDIHAKMYYVQERGGGKWTNKLFIGSLNASANAFYKNVECLLELVYRPNVSSLKIFMDDIFPDNNNPFEEITEISESEIQFEEKKVSFRDVFNANLSAEISKNGEQFEIMINCKPIEEMVEIAPLYKQKNFIPLSDKVIFHKMLLTELSEFYVLRRGSDSTIIKIPTNGLPTEDRNNAIFSKIIGNKQDFLKYVVFMLSDSFSESLSDALGELMKQTKKKGVSYVPPVAVYESMLRSAAEDPEKILAIEDVIGKLDQEIVSEDFRKLFNTVKAATKTRRK